MENSSFNHIDSENNLDLEIELIQSLTFSKTRQLPFLKNGKGGCIYYEASYHRIFPVDIPVRINWALTVRAKGQNNLSLNESLLKAYMGTIQVGESKEVFSTPLEFNTDSGFETLAWLQDIAINCDEDGFIDLEIWLKINDDNEFREVRGRGHCYVKRIKNLKGAGVFKALKAFAIRRTYP